MITARNVEGIMGIDVRDILLTLYGGVWATVVLITVWRSQEIPNGLLAALGVGVGGLLAAFRADSLVSGRMSNGKKPDPERDNTP